MNRRESLGRRQRERRGKSLQRRHPVDETKTGKEEDVSKWEKKKGIWGERKRIKSTSTSHRGQGNATELEPKER